MGRVAGIGPREGTMSTERKVIYHYKYKRSPDQDATAPVRHDVVIVGRRAGRARGGDRSRAARRQGRAARRFRQDRRRLARHLLRQAHAGNPRSPRCRRKAGRAGRDLEARQGLSQGRTRSIPSICCRKTATRCRPSSIFSNIIWRRRWSIVRWNCRISICAGAIASPVSSSATMAQR